MYSEARIGKHLSEELSMQNSQKQWTALSPLIVILGSEYASRTALENEKRF